MTPRYQDPHVPTPLMYQWKDLTRRGDVELQIDRALSVRGTVAGAAEELGVSVRTLQRVQRARGAALRPRGHRQENET